MKKQITIYFTIFFFSIANSQKINGVKISPLQNQYSENDSIPKVIYGNEREAKKPIILLNNKYVASEVLNTLNSDKIEYTYGLTTLVRPFLMHYKLMLMILKIMSKSYQSHAYDLSNS